MKNDSKFNLVRWLARLGGAGLALALVGSTLLWAQDADDSEDNREGLRRLDVEPVEAAVEDQDAAEEAAEAEDVTEPVTTPTEDGEFVASEDEADSRPSARRRHRSEIIQIGSDVHVRSNEDADVVVAILGSSVIDGDVDEVVVSILGDVTINGSSRGEAIAVFGSVTVNGSVGGEAVAVFGNVQVGPGGEINGETVSVGGEVDLAPGAEAYGHIQAIPLPGNLPELAVGLRTWFAECLFKGRLLAFNADVMWAWGLAGGALVFYLFLVLLLGSATEKCVETLEQKPGLTLLAGLLTALLGPILVALLSVVAVGVLLWIALFMVGIYGNAVFITWLGRRITRPLGWNIPVVATAIGGVILILTYTIPVLGFIMFNLSGFVGTGMVVYAILLAMQREKPPPATPAPSAGGGAGAVPAAAGAAATTFTPAPDVSGEPSVSGEAAGKFSSGYTGRAGVATAPGESPTTGDATPSAPPPPEPVLPPVGESAPPPPPPSGPASGAKPPPVPNPQLSLLPRAGFWIRVAASVLDLILISVVSGVLGFDEFIGLWFATYNIAMWAIKSTTIGGVICGLKIVRLDDKPLDWSVALIRGLGAFLSFVVVGLGFIWVAFDPERQSWHDKIAGTTIVRMPKGSSLI